MDLFDVKKYQLPDISEVDWEKTMDKIGVFLRSYKVARERVGVSILPKMTERFTLIHEEMRKHEELDQSIYYQEYVELHQLFILGFSAIVHPFRPEFTIRRKQVFMLRYVYGLSIALVSERIHYQKNVIVEDSKVSVIQFAAALSILVLKK